MSDNHTTHPSCETTRFVSGTHAHILAAVCAGGSRPEAGRVAPHSVDMPSVDTSGAQRPDHLLGVNTFMVDPSGVGNLSAAAVQINDERDCWHEVVIKAMAHPVDGR